MRGLKTLFATLAIFCLALSSLMASPNTWAWLSSSPSSEVSQELPETLPEVPEVLMKESEGSKASSKESKKVEKVEYVTIEKAELEAIIALIEEGNAYNKRGGVQVKEATDNLVAIAAPVKESKFQHFMTLDAEHGFGAELKFGVSYGFIFKDCLIAKMGVMKSNGIQDWLVKENYVGTASIGIVF